MKELESTNHCSTCVYKDLLFGRLNIDDLSFLNESKKEIAFKKGEIISEEGTEIKSFLYLKHGLVKLFKKNPL